MDQSWLTCFTLNTAMLAALLLFLRGQGYRLERGKSLFRRAAG
jgi:hypothetical protein